MRLRRDRPAARRLAWMLAMLPALAGGVAASDTQAVLHLRKGHTLSLEHRPGEAYAEFFQAYGHADSAFLRVEALARMAGETSVGSRTRASGVNRLMTLFEASPPRWLSDTARKILSAEIATRAGSGQFPHQLPEPGIRSLDFSSSTAGTGFRGKRYFHIVHLSDLPAPDAQLDGLPLLDDRDRLYEKANGSRLESGGWSVIDPRHAGSDTAEAERLRWRFDRCVVGYTFEPIHTRVDLRGEESWVPIQPWYEGDQDSIWRLRFRVYYPSPEAGGRAEFALLAENLVDALLRAHWLGREALGREAMDGNRLPEILSVWLTPNATDLALHAGGERWLDNLYFYHAGTPRADQEWIREAFHEYAHAMMPRIGMYSETEQHELWMEGPLGERLLLIALGQALPSTGDDQLSAWFLDLKARPWLETYRREQCDPLVSAWLEHGPLEAQRQGSDDRAAAVAAGFGLWVAETHDPGFVLSFYSEPAPSRRYGLEELMAAYAARVSNEEQTSFVVRPGRSIRIRSDTRPIARDEGLELAADVEIEIPLWLPRAAYGIRVVSPQNGLVTIQLGEGDRKLVETGRTAKTAPATPFPGRGEWTTLRIAGFGDNPTVVASIALERRGRVQPR